MSLRSLGKLGVLLLLLVWAIPAIGGPLDEFFASVARDTKRRNCWPQPFVYPDRQSAREPFALMVANGWEIQNLLGDIYFDSEGQLTEAGRLRVSWIINEAPEQHRTVYVHRADKPQDTSARVAAVQKFVIEASVGLAAPQIVVSNKVDGGWPAEQVDALSKKAVAAAPSPTLPSSSGGSSSSSSGH